MSERITQELRKKMKSALGWYDEDGNIVCSTGGEPVSEMECFVINSKAFGELCDAIDAVHKSLERENESLRRELDRVTGEMDEMHKSGDSMQNAEHHAWAPESHYMMLPKDAEGEPIHLFDLMDTERGVETVEGILPDRFLVLRDDRWLTVEAATHRHHHAPTVEDVLRECVAAYMSTPLDESNDNDFFAKYAAKLQLRGDAE